MYIYSECAIDRRSRFDTMIVNVILDCLKSQGHGYHGTRSIQDKCDN